MGYRTAAQLIAAALLGACQPHSRPDTANHETATRSAAARVPVPRRIRFYVPPLVATSDHPADRTDTLWSPNDDRDSILVVLSGNDVRGIATLLVDVGVGPLTMDDEPSNARPIPRIIRWITLYHVSVDTLRRWSDGRLLMVVSPSALSRSPRLALRSHEAVRSLRVRATLPDGTDVHGTIELLPAI